LNRSHAREAWVSAALRHWLPFGETAIQADVFN